jgi:hypothetical protein
MFPPVTSVTIKGTLARPHSSAAQQRQPPLGESKTAESRPELVPVALTRTSLPVTEKFTGFEDDSDDKESFLSAASPMLSPCPSTMPIGVRRMMLMSSSLSTGLDLNRHTSSSGHGWEDYSLRIVIAGAITTDGSGIVAQAFSADPSVLSFSEWSSFAALFDEVKLESYHMRVSPYQGVTNGTAPCLTSIAMGSFLNKGSTPSSILSVLVARDGKLISPLMTTPQGIKLTAPKLGFAPTTTPAGTSAYGCPGYIHLYCTSGQLSKPILTYYIVARYHLRGRM